MIGVKFEEKHSYKDWGMILTSVVITPPTPQLNLVTIPLRDGSIDLTELLTGDVKYTDRTIKLTFAVIDKRKKWSAKISEIANYLHGKKMQIVIDDDIAFYYAGRAVINEWDSNESTGKLVIECTVEPYKYDIQSSAEDWLWDSFDFENGYIHESSEVVVDGSATVIVFGRRKRTYPTIIVSDAMTVTFAGSTYNLSTGSNKMYEMLLGEGENELTFSGTGTVTIEYRGGSL